MNNPTLSKAGLKKPAFFFVESVLKVLRILLLLKVKLTKGGRRG
jgi:hypothetical protein